MYVTRRMLSLLLAPTLVLGVSAPAAGTPPDPNPPRDGRPVAVTGAEAGDRVSGFDD